MDDKQFKELITALKSIEGRLDLLIRISKVSAPKVKITDEEERILQLCDKKHTREDMVKKTGKKLSNVDKILSQLRSKGLIKSKKQGDKLVSRTTGHRPVACNAYWSGS